MNHRPSGCGSQQSKNRALVPQKLRHFFDSFPHSYEIPCLPDWILRRPMGSVWCVPKSPELNHFHPPGTDHQRQRGRRNRIEPLSNAQFLPKRRSISSKRANKVANLTYKNTWSSFLKTSQSDHVRFFPSKTLVPGQGRTSVRFDKNRSSWDDSVLDRPERQRSADTALFSVSNRPRSASPVRRRPSSMRVESRKYSKLESKALREAWLHENVFPHFSFQHVTQTVTTAEQARRSSSKNHNTHTFHELVRSVPPYQSMTGKRRGSIDVNVSSGTSNDTFLTPGSMEMSGTSTLPTTSGSLQVNATSSPSSSFDSMQARYSTRPVVPSLLERDQHYKQQQQRRCLTREDSLVETTTNSQSVEVQVSSTITSSPSMHPHLSSSSGAGCPSVLVQEVSAAAAVARDILRKERAIFSANSRKSCLKERNGSNSHGHLEQASNFKDPSRLEWTKRYLYTLAPPSMGSYYNDRSSSMSRVASSNQRSFQVYPITQQRLWQSSPDLRIEIWKPDTHDPTSLSGEDPSAHDVVEMMKANKKQFMEQLLQERTAEAQSYRLLKRDIRSLAMLQTSNLTRSLSAAGRSRSSDQFSVSYGSEDPSKWTKILGSSDSSRGKFKNLPDYKSQEMLVPEWNSRKKRNRMNMVSKTLHTSSEILAQNGEKDVVAEKSILFPSPPIARRSVAPPASRMRSPDKRPRSSTVKFNALQSFAAPLQPASGENKASSLRRSLTRKKCEEALAHSWRQQQVERERRSRLRAIRMDPAWVQVRGADQALEDIAHRRCYKEVVERERLLQYYMEKEEMLNRVWQMPPLFERQAPSRVDRCMSSGSKRMEIQPHLLTTATMSTVAAPSSPPPTLQSVRVGSARRKASFRNKSSNKEDNAGNRYLANESLQLSRPSTAKSSTTKSIGVSKCA